MKTKVIVRGMAMVAVTVMLTLFLSSYAGAGTLTLTLARVGALVNVDDAAGRYQYEGGTVYKGSAAVGKYAITRRVTLTGTSAYNTAMETITIFFSVAGTAPPQNITVEGAHSFTNGKFVGSVSAASNRYNWVQGADAYTTISGTTHYLYLSWTGANQLTLP